jgi:hypothetical protein
LISRNRHVRSIGGGAEKEAEAQAQKAHEAKEQQRAASWWAAIDHRITQHLRRYFMSGDEEHPGMLTEAIGLTMAENRKLARKELNDAIENSERRLAEKLVELEERLKSVPGKLPVVKAWRQESVTYQAEMVSHKGSLYQARRDTAQPPGGSDWICVARHGRDAVTPVVRGDYDAHESYAELDIVSFDGAAYIARSDNPGIPGHGEGWQVFGSERMDLRAEVKAAIEEERQLVDAKLAALEQASNDRWAVIDQRILQHIERAREPVLQSTRGVLGQFRADLREEFKLVLEEKERAFEAKLAALEERLKSVPGKLPVVKSSWQPESMTYQAEMVCHEGALYQARKDTPQAPGGSDWI